MEEDPNFRWNKIIIKMEHQNKLLPKKKKKKLTKSVFSQKKVIRFSWKTRGEAGDSANIQEH